MVQCTACTKQHRQCLNQAKHNTVCGIHENYYKNWFETHPPPRGFRLQLPEKPEYQFQIENQHVQITNKYVCSFVHPDESDYYEYLLHLPHIQWDTNVRMLVHLYIQFLNQPNCIQITNSNIDYYFHNMFRNPTFRPGTFLLRLLYLIREKERRENFLPNLTHNRIVEIIHHFVHHPAFEGFLYMDWTEECKEILCDSHILAVFLPIVHTKREEWKQEKQSKSLRIQSDLLEIAMHPSRVQDWYMDWEQRRQIQTRFLQKIDSLPSSPPLNTHNTPKWFPTNAPGAATNSRPSNISSGIKQ